jgi:hypothetical protein
MSVITGRSQALVPGILVPEGELLVDGFELFRGTLPSSGGPDDFAFAIPSSAALLGFEGHAQGVILTSTGRMRLGNALVLKLGR